MNQTLSLKPGAWVVAARVMHQENREKMLVEEILTPESKPKPKLTPRPNAGGTSVTGSLWSEERDA